MQKERFIQVSKVDEEERKRREQQKLEREQVRGPNSEYVYVAELIAVGLTAYLACTGGAE